MRNLDDVKASAKTAVSVPQDYHSFVFQVKAYALSSKYIFGVNSILIRQLFLIVEKNNITALLTSIGLLWKKTLQQKSFGQPTNLSTSLSKNAPDVTIARTLTNAASILMTST